MRERRKPVRLFRCRICPRPLLIAVRSARLFSDPAWRYGGDQEGGRFGSSIDSVGDVNNDGFDDFIVGASQQDGLNSTSGNAYLFFGNITFVEQTPVILSIDSFEANFGTSVTSAGDFNNDGISDFAVGLPGFNDGEGRALVYLGNESGDFSSPCFFTSFIYGFAIWK